MGSAESTVSAPVHCPVTAAGDQQPTPAVALPPGVAVERRRPGRPLQVNEHLLPLLRDAANAPVRQAPPLFDTADRPRTPLSGIFNAILISSVLWCLIAFAARAVVS